MGDVIYINEESFDKVVSQGVVVVDFYADWCGPCKMFAPIFEEGSADYDGKALFAKINVDDNKDVAVNYKVLGIPTIVFFKDGEAVDRVSGVLDKATFYSKIDAIL